MRSTWIAAAVTTAVATGLLTAGVSGAMARGADDSPAPPTTSANSTDADASSFMVHAGPLGGVLTSASDLVESTRSEAGTRDPRAMHDRLSSLNAAVGELRAGFRGERWDGLAFDASTRDSAAPSSENGATTDSSAAESTDQQSGQAGSGTTTATTTTTTSSKDLDQALTRLVDDASRLVRMAEDDDTDDASVRTAAAPLSRDTLTILSSTMRWLSRR